MKFYERYEMLCKEAGLRPQSKEILKIMGVSSPAVIRWKEGSSPNISTISKLCDYFDVTSDYLLGFSDVRNKPTLTREEWNMVKAYRSLQEEDSIEEAM